MLKVRNIQFVPIGTLNTNIASQSYLQNDSDAGEEDVSLNDSALATPSHSSPTENRSVSASPACTPRSITRELTQVANLGEQSLTMTLVNVQFDLEPDEQPSTPRAAVPVKKRKRLISDRGECELKFPVCDYRTAKNSWHGCSFVNPNVRACGAGLHNPSNYCFLNSVLQSVVHTAQLARYLFEHHDLNNCVMRMPCLHCALKRHIQQVVGSKHPTNPSWMRQFFGKIFPSHRRDHQEDAHEMLTLLLSALEPPLLPKKAVGNGDADKSPTKATAYATPSTAIEQIFGGSLRNKITCNDCTTSYINYEKIREMNVGLLPRYHGQEIPLSQLLGDFFGEEHLQGFICKKCNGKRSASRNTTILRSPSVLLIQLKRFSVFGGKNRLTVRPEPVLYLDRFMYNKEAERYRFSGVIQHIGGGLNFGHYVSAFRGFDERSWFYFDDSDVSSFSVQKALQMEPYILFYTKIREESQPTPTIELPLNGFKQTMTPQLTNDHSAVKNTSDGTSDEFGNGNGVRKSSPVVYGPQLPPSSTDQGSSSKKWTLNHVNGNANGASPTSATIESNGHKQLKANGTTMTKGYRNGNEFGSDYDLPTTNHKSNGHSNSFGGYQKNGFGSNSHQKNAYRTPNNNSFNGNRKFHYNNSSDHCHNGNGNNRTLADYGFKLGGKRYSSDSEPPNDFGKRQRFSVGTASPVTSNGGGGGFRSISASPKPPFHSQSNNNGISANGSSTKQPAAYKSNGPVSFKIAKKQTIRPMSLF